MKSMVKLLPVLIMSVVLLGSPTSEAAIKGAPSKSESGKVLQSTGQVNAPKGTPTWEVQSIETKLEEYETGNALSSEQRAKNKKIKKEILSGTFDLRELSRLALDRHWGSISDSQKSSFVSLMTSLLQTKAIFSKEQSKTQGNSYIVRYKGDQFLNGKNKAKTITQIYIPKENITLDIEYMLRKSSGGWKVFDIIVDDASLVENYRYQFNKIISKHGYSELVRRMRKKLQELQTQPS